MLEYRVRVMAICEIHIDPRPLPEITRPLSLLSGISVSDRETQQVKNCTHEISLRAMACYSHYFFWAYWLVHGGRLLHQESFTILKAASAANFCAERGHLPSCSASPGGSRRAGHGSASTCARSRSIKRSARCGRRMTSIFSVPAWSTPFIARRLRRRRTFTSAPTRKATHKGTLKRCSGRYLPERKPHYWSAYCQRNHTLALHCSPRILQTSLSRTYDVGHIVDHDGDPNWVDIPGCRHPNPRVLGRDWKPKWPLWTKQEGGEIFLDIYNDSRYRKGEVIRIRTRTLSPECLKAYKGLWKVTPTEEARRVVDLLMIDPPKNMGFPS